jgi:diphthine-ammonia ligase
LQQLYPTLLRLHDRFELDLCGEGGEYESLVLDSRAFKKTLVLTDTIIDYDAEDESVGCLRVLSCEAQMKEGCLDSEHDKLNNATPSTLPPVLCQPFFTSRVPTLLPVSPLVQSPLLRYQPRLSFCASGLCQTGLLLPVCEHLSPSVSPAEQLHSVFQGLSGALVQAGYDIKDSVFVHLYVADMNQFESINQEYRKWFGNNPPSRSCIQVLIVYALYLNSVMWS